jgi:hypothetical protein
VERIGPERKSAFNGWIPKLVIEENKGASASPLPEKVRGFAEFQ